MEEIPLSDQNLRKDIVKEFEKMYGKGRCDQLFVKENLGKSGNDMVEMVIRQMHLAKKKLSKLGYNDKTADNLIVRP